MLLCYCYSNMETEAQESWVTCWGARSKELGEPVFEYSSVWLKAHIIPNLFH